MNAPPTPARPQSHVSIDSDDLPRSKDFYRALFGVEPALERPDYVRFWPAEFGLVLALNAGPLRLPPVERERVRGTGTLQHLGLLFPDADALAAARERLARAGFETSGAADTECCHARLDQFWATDPGGVRWELFLVHEEVLAADWRAPQASSCCTPSCCR